MRRIDSANVRANVNGAGKVGFHDNADLPGADATYLTPNWLNILQEELCNILEKNGVALNPNSTQQLFDLLTTSADISALATATQAKLDAKADKTVSMQAGTGLLGGGTLAANRTFSVAYGTTVGTATQGNDSRVNNGQTAYGWGNHATQGYLKSSDLSGLEFKADKTISIDAGNGLTGGGNLSASRTITLGMPLKISAETNNAVSTTSHTHEIDKATTLVAGVVQLNNTLTSTSVTQALTAAQGKALKDLIASSGGLGVGQTWKNMTSIRASGVMYTNTTGKPLFVSLYTQGTGGGTVAYVMGQELGPRGSEGTGTFYLQQNFFIVPDGQSYSVTFLGSVHTTWWELRT